MRYRSAMGSTSRSMPRLRIEYGVFDYQDPGVSHAPSPFPVAHGHPASDWPSQCLFD
jgi:hypothetical protein